MRLEKKNLKAVLALLAEDHQVFVPGEGNPIKRFTLWQGEDVALDGENTLLPPKDIFFPKTEKMYTYTLGENMDIQELSEAPRRVVFGMRPCDVHSIECLDDVFIKEGYTDTFYAKRRENCLMVAVGCTQCGANCFCEAMGLDPNSAPYADIFLSDGGEFYSVEAQTEKGTAALEKWRAYLYEGAAVKGDTHCALHPAMSENLAEDLKTIFNDDAFWDEVSRPCLKCGTCSFVCPTCYCFDINDSNVGSEGMAFRCWDSCMFSDYNQNAGGHNPRPTKKERLRNRYMHKLSYFKDRHGIFLCAGCGRCVNKCPAHLDITELIDKAAEVCHD